MRVFLLVDLMGVVVLHKVKPIELLWFKRDTDELQLFFYAATT